MWSLFGNPKSLGEAYGLSTHLVRIAGLFPYYYDTKNGRFQFSWKLFLLTLGHITVYTYVNITFMLDDWRDYAQPLIGHSILAAIGNLWLRILGIVITFMILAPVVMGSRDYVTVLNIYASLLGQCALLGIDVQRIFRRIYSYGMAVTLCQAGIVVFSSWHSTYFYERITEKEPTFKYYVVVVLSNYYKMMFLFYAYMHLLSIYLMSSELNRFLKELVQQERKRYEREQRKRIGYLADVKDNFDD